MRSSPMRYLPSFLDAFSIWDNDDWSNPIWEYQNIYCIQEQLFAEFMGWC